MPFTVQLSKERFKFSSTHFTIFSEDRAEALHGHNYSVSVNLEFKSLDEKTGLAAEFSDLKSIISEICDHLDEKVLLPSQSPFLNIEDENTNWKVTFANKHYSFPKMDCEVLEMVNTSSECLAQWLHEKLEIKFQKLGATFIEVEVKETQGQSVTFRR
ncbi:MAG: 6-carboxytetrahydropterin synthase [Pseudomonadota bacterium]